MDVLTTFFSTEWLQEPFMIRALLAMVFLAPACAALGTHVISFRMAFFSDAISHSVFTGIALGIILGLDPRLSTLLFGIFLGFLLIQLGKKSQLSRDALIAVLMASAVSFGIVLVSMKKRLAHDFQSALYGDVLTVNATDITLIVLFAILVFVFEAIAFNRLLLIATDTAMAKSHGVIASLWEMLLAFLVAIITLVGVRVVGLLMVTSLMVVPAAAGRNLGRTARSSFLWSILIAILASYTGLGISWLLDSSAGATIVLTASVFFALSLPFANRSKNRL